jgi:hypothetical protein
VVDSLLLLDLHLPGLNVLAYILEDGASVLEGAGNDNAEVIKTGVNLLEEVSALVGSIRARVQVGAEGLADLLNLSLELLSLEKDDEDVLLGNLTVLRVLKILINLSIFHVEVTAGGTEEDTLECGELLARDNTSNVSTFP